MDDRFKFMCTLLVGHTVRAKVSRRKEEKKGENDTFFFFFFSFSVWMIARRRPALVES